MIDGTERLMAAIEQGGDINERDKSGRTILHYAATRPEIEVIRKILEYGADVNAKDRSGETPLHMACREGRLEIVEELIASGSKPDEKDSDGNTPLFRAVYSYSGDGRIIQTLLKAGADMNAKNNHDGSPLELARLIASTDVLKHLTPT